MERHFVQHIEIQLDVLDSVFLDNGVGRASLQIYHFIIIN
jgi:hypothetical protein